MDAAPNGDLKFSAASPIGLGGRTGLLATSEVARRHASPLNTRTHRELRRSHVDGPVGGRIKRGIDIAVAGSALLIIAPIIPVIVALIKMSSRGPAFFSHPRVGFSGATFPCYKFRTMVLDGDRVLTEHLASNATAAAEWRKNQKLAQDPRITAIGHILRKSSLDEVPQLLNVLRGDMSCIGPRPVTHSELSRYGSRRADYMRARPGLTGFWQVSGRSACSYARRVSLDAYYVRSWSLWLDAVILVKTIPCLLRFDESA